MVQLNQLSLFAECELLETPTMTSTTQMNLKCWQNGEEPIQTHTPTHVMKAHQFDNDPEGQLEGEIRSGINNRERGRMCCVVTLSSFSLQKQSDSLTFLYTYTHIRVHQYRYVIKQIHIMENLFPYISTGQDHWIAGVAGADPS